MSTCPLTVSATDVPQNTLKLEIREDAREQKDPGMAVDASAGGEGNAGAAEAEAE